LQTSFGYNCIALADGLQPKLLNLLDFLQIFIDHRRTIITRRGTCRLACVSRWSGICVE